MRAFKTVPLFMIVLMLFFGSYSPSLAKKLRPRFDLVPAWSPNGENIAFQSDREGTTDIWIVRSNGFGAENLTYFYRGIDRRAMWSPDGSRLAFFSDRSGQEDIWIMDANGEDRIQMQVDVTEDDHTIEWSPDGCAIAFETTRTDENGLNYASIWVVDVETLTQTRISPDDDLAASFRYPSWSPDGQQIAFVGGRTGHMDSYLWIADADGSNVRQITSDDLYVSRVDWSSHDDLVIKELTTGIWTLKPSGEDLSIITEGDIYTNPIWSPDGEKLLLASYGQGYDSIWVMDRDGSNLMQLAVDIEGHKMFPSWSPDSQKLAFAAFVRGESGASIWTISVDGSNLSNLSEKIDEHY